MPVITYNDFSGGLDLRLPINVQDSSKLLTLNNAYVTTGKKIRKRPGLRLVDSTLGGSFGLEVISDALAVFAETGSGYAAPAFMFSISLDHPPGAVGGLVAIPYADVFQGFPYVVARYADGQTFHHYVDGATTYISDVNCPHTNGITKAASRIFAPDLEVVRYCAAGDARDWTTASDAGFLPAALQQDTKGFTTACGTFADSLVVFFSENSQVWDVAVDPTANQIRKRIPGVGTIYPCTLAGFANDLMFLAPFGFRSMTTQQTVDRIDDNDVGVPIDKLISATDVQAALASNISLLRDVQGAWIHQFGQYWCFYVDGLNTVAWVYTYSKTSKIACWSKYTFPVVMTAVATLNGKVYLRTSTTLYEVDDDTYTDDGSLIDVEVQMAFQDAKTPGVDKQFDGADFAFNGSASVSYLYDPRDPGKETTPYTIQGDTRHGDMNPVEVVAPAIAPKFVHSANEEFEIDAVQLYYQLLRS